nr:phage holin family protein [uncultured Flavobacterium sp.]
MKTFQYLAGSVLSFLAPLQGLLLAVGFAIILDTFTGIFKAIKLGGWSTLKSRRLSDIAAKVLLYNTAVLSVYIIDHFLLSGFMKHWFSADYLFTKIIALVLVVIELTSVKENFEAVYRKDLWKLLKSIISRTKEITSDISDLKP